MPSTRPPQRLGDEYLSGATPNLTGSGVNSPGDSVATDERVRLITDIEALHTFSGMINRTRRRDIGAFTIRKPETVTVAFTPSQQWLHDELIQVQAEIFRRLHGDVNVEFMMTTIRRQAASCLYGLAPFLEDILNRHIDELEWEEADNTGPQLSGDAVDPIHRQIRAILAQARSLDPRDPKLDALCKVIRDKQSLPNNKVMLFSSFSPYPPLSLQASRGGRCARRDDPRRDARRGARCTADPF